MKSRKGERPRSYFRSERIQQANSVWYLLTRENFQEGPFRTRPEAIATLERHARVWNCNLFSNYEFDRINSLGLQTDAADKSGLSAANELYHAATRMKKTQRR